MIAPVSEEMIEAGLQHYSEGGCSGLAEYERREVVKDILTAGMEVFGSITPDERSEYWRGAYDRIAARNIEDGTRIAALSADNERLRKALEEVQSAQFSNHGCMATILSEMSKIATAALEAKP